MSLQSTPAAPLVLPHEARPEDWALRHLPDDPVLLFSQQALTRTAAAFQAGFPGQVTYAVKANPHPLVIEGLVAAGLTAFDVASPAEMALVRAVLPDARLHYHNPVRSAGEIAQAKAYGIASWSVDRLSELDKLGDIAGQEIAVRLHLPVSGAAYDFGAKFGATPALAEALLRQVVARGARPALTFHPGTQCTDPAPWARYIEGAAQVAVRAGVSLARLNVGGGFPAHRDATAPDLEAIFATIRATVQAQFEVPPLLVCEPGRAMVADAVQLVLRIKAGDGAAVFLNDGIYGALSEWRDIAAGGRITVLAPDGRPRQGALRPQQVWGPTCDSLDQLPHPLPLPEDLAEGDFVLVAAMGAYAGSLATGFNGYGARRMVSLANHTCDASPMDTGAQTPSLRPNKQPQSGAGTWKNSGKASRSNGPKTSAF